MEVTTHSEPFTGEPDLKPAHPLPDNLEVVAGENGQVQVQQKEAPPQEAERPAWLPEKFKTQEDMAKAYSELEKKVTELSSKPGAKKAPAAPEKKAEEPAKGAAEDLTLSQAAEDIDWDGAAAEYQANEGKLSDETYVKFAKNKIPKERVDRYLALEAMAAQQEATTVLQSVGMSAQDFKSMSDWAVTVMDQTEVDAFNKAVGDRGTAKFAVEALKARYAQANGKAPKLVEGNKPQPSNDSYSSWAQVVEVVNSPKYKTDPAFRRAHEQKLSRSGKLAG